MVDVTRFNEDRIIDCEVNTSSLWAAESLLMELGTVRPERLKSRTELLEGVTRLRDLVEQFGGSIGDTLDEVRIPILHAQVMLAKSLTLDEESRETIQEDLEDAGRKIRTTLAFEFTECLLAGEEFEKRRKELPPRF